MGCIRVKSPATRASAVAVMFLWSHVAIVEGLPNQFHAMSMVMRSPVKRRLSVKTGHRSLKSGLDLSSVGKSVSEFMTAESMHVNEAAILKIPARRIAPDLQT